jgi:hypothetical protein
MRPGSGLQAVKKVVNYGFSSFFSFGEDCDQNSTKRTDIVKLKDD